MSNVAPRQSNETDDAALGTCGCAVFFLAGVLYALQRFTLFSWLLWQASLGHAFAPSVAEFLFGNPPYTLTDILLGLEFPDEGLLYLLQPHNLSIAVTQAAHFATTIGLVSVPFLLFLKARSSTRHRVWLRMGGCLSALAIPVAFALPVGVCVVTGLFEDRGSVPAAAAPLPMTTYESEGAGISIAYPSFMTIEEESQKDRAPGGAVVTLTEIYASSTDPVVALLVTIIEDPSRDESYPSLYPPTDSTLRLLGFSAIGRLQYPTTDVNRAAVEEATDSATITTISGYPAITYALPLEGLDIGHAYVHTAFIATDARDVMVYLVGSDEEGVSGSVDPSTLNELWSRVVASVSLSR